MRYAILSFLLFLASCLTHAQTVTSFEGIDDSEVPTPQLDLDPNGAVGTKQYMEWINVYYQAYDKVTFAPLWPTPQPGITPWVNNGIPNCSAVGGDGVIIFDRLALRWVIAFHTSPASLQYYYCIAVSSTDDLTSPTLAWYTYAFFLNPVLGTNPQGQTYFPDWPKIGTWADAYYVAFDLEDVAQKHLNIGSMVCAFDRTNMLIGNPTPDPMQCFSANPNQNGALFLGHSLIPADVEGTTPPPVGRDEFLVSIQNPPNDGKSTTSNTINLWDFHVDWVTPTNSTFTSIPLTVTTYTPGCYTATGIFNTYCAPEPAVNPLNHAHYHVDTVGDRLMPRLDYRNFGTYESFLVSHTIRTGKNTNTQTGIRWYELRGSGTPAVYQEGNLAPDTTLFRFMPSIAQDQDGNAAVGYSVSNGAATHPGIKAAWWNLEREFSPIELSIQTGKGDEENTTEWGDYTSMTVDPVDDCTFWYVNEYLPTNETGPPPNRNTRIANFKIPTCGSQISPINFVQVADATPSSNQSKVTVTYPLAQTQGNMNIVAVGWHDAVSTVKSVTDSLGNTYSLAIGPTTGDKLRQSIYYAPNTHSGANTVTVTFSRAAATPDIRVLEYSGLDPVSPFDVTTGAHSNTLLASSGSVTTNFSSELLFGADMAATTSGPGAGYTSRVVTPDGDIAEDNISSVTGSYSATAPLKAKGPWVMQIATFKAAGQ